MEWGWDNARALIGIALIYAIAWALSENRKAFPWRIVLGAVGLQFAFALVLFGVPFVRKALASANTLVDALEQATAAGTGLIFGPVLGVQENWEAHIGAPGPIFIFQVLPLIIVVAALSAMLWHWGVLRWVTRGFALIFQRLMGIGGATSLGVSANVFMGMTEAPVLIKPYLKAMTRSEIFIIMVSGFATIAGSVLVIYVGLLGNTFADPLAQLFSASIMACPAAVALALVIVPETAAQEDRKYEPDFGYKSTMDAFATGASDGLQILLNVATMLIAALALLHLANLGLGALPQIGGADLSIQRILGWVFSPVMYFIGVPLEEAARSGSLMGVKTVLTEFVAFLELANIPEEEMTSRTRMITAHAINGFANFGSMGILIGGLTIIEPARRDTFLSLAWKTMIAGSLATCLSGAVVGALPVALFLGS